MEVLGGVEVIKPRLYLVMVLLEAAGLKEGLRELFFTSHCGIPIHSRIDLYFWYCLPRSREAHLHVQISVAKAGSFDSNPLAQYVLS